MFRTMKRLSIIYDNSYHYKRIIQQFPTKVYKINMNNHKKVNNITKYYAFLGVIKRVPHYINENNEIFIKNENEYDHYEYVSNWCNLYKMPYTLIKPQIFGPLKLKNKRYFYDFREYDTYYYDVMKQQVYYQGRYDPKTNIIKIC